MDRYRVRSVVLGVGVALLLGATGCGGTDRPTTQRTPSASPTPSPSSASPSPSPSAAPLSGFEDDPAVQGLRAWARATTLDINADGPSGSAALTNTRPLVTDNGLKVTRVTIADEIRDKVLYRGPVPFTQVQVQASASRTSITACLLAGGYGLNRATGKPDDKRNVIGIDVEMVKGGAADATWKLDSIETDDAVPCLGVRIVEVSYAQAD